MQQHPTRWLLALNLLVVVGLVAALVQVTQHGPGALSIEGGLADASALDDDARTEGDIGTFESKFYPGTDFRIRSSPDWVTQGSSSCFYADSGTPLRLGVELPNGATIVSVELYADDTDSTSDMTFDLFYVDHSGFPASSLSLSPMFSATTTGGGGRQVVTDSTPATTDAAVIDSVNRTYELLVQGTSNDELVCGARILWLPASTTDLTFHEVEPCAAFDTRAGRGGREAPLAGLETVTFDTVLGDHSGQGGVATSCGVPTPIGGSDGEGTVAVMLNLVALNPESTGNLKAWDPDTTEPDGGVLVYTTGESTNVVLPMAAEDQSEATDGGDVNVKNNGGSPVDVRGVIVGYFTRPPINQE